MYSEYLIPSIYLFIGLLFGEMSLRVKPIANTSGGRGLGYILAVTTWPLIVVIALFRKKT